MISFTVTTLDQHVCEFDIPAAYSGLRRFIKKSDELAKGNAITIELPYTRTDILMRARPLKVPLLERIAVIALFHACGIEGETAFRLTDRHVTDIIAALELHAESPETPLAEIFGMKSASA